MALCAGHARLQRLACCETHAPAAAVASATALATPAMLLDPTALATVVAAEAAALASAATPLCVESPKHNRCLVYAMCHPVLQVEPHEYRQPGSKESGYT